MKTIFFALGLAGLVLSSAVTAILGLFMMGNQLYAGTNNFLPGFEVFSLSTITFFVTVTAYIATRILESTSETLLKMIAFDMKEEAKKNMINNPLAALFGGMGMPGAWTIQMSKMDENGNMIPFAEKEFNSPEEFIKYRNELLAKAFGHKPEESNKKLEEMSIEQLKEKEKKAVDSQDFELAAAIRDVIDEKKKNK